MTIVEGTRFGPYEIVSLRGAGGMGEVYRARDTRLDRTVAIKVLAPALARRAPHRAADRRRPRSRARPRHRAFTNLASSSDRAYDMMPDGHFLSVTDPPLSEAGLGSMTIVLNWFEELKQRVPVR